MVAWGVALFRMPMGRFDGYRHLQQLWAWAGDPHTILSLGAITIGTGIVASDRTNHDLGRRCFAVAAIAFWLQVACGFVGPHQPPTAAIAYIGLAWLNSRTARGLPPL